MNPEPIGDLVIPIAIVLVAALIGYRRGGVREAIAYSVIALGVYLGVLFAISLLLIPLGSGIEDILSEVGDSI